MVYKGKETVVADIPGLIEGASEGKGLGGEFLRHVERTKILVHLVSVEEDNPIKTLNIINNELKQFSKLLVDKPQVVLLSKIDTINLEDFKVKVAQFKKKNIATLQISSISGVGIDKLKDKIIEELS